MSEIKMERKVDELSRQITADQELIFQRELVLNSKKIDWQKTAAIYLNEEQMTQIRQYDAADLEGRTRLMEDSGEKYAELILLLLGSLKQGEHIKYLLILVDEIFDEMPIANRRTRVNRFLNAGKEGSIDVFISLLDMQDTYLQYLAAQAAGTLVGTGELKEVHESQGERLLRWIKDILRKSEGVKDPQGQRACVKSLQNALQNDAMRVKFSEMQGPAVLSGILNDQYKAVMEAKKEAANTEGETSETTGAGRDMQLIYEMIFAYWLLSFNEVIAKNDFSGNSIILNVVRIMREVDNEKIRRVGLSMLRNLSGKAECDEAMIHAGFWKVVMQFSVKRWADEDMANDVQFLLERMENKMMDMTTFDRYKQELLTGQLEWSPVHKSEKFWKENFGRFNERDFELVGILGALLKSEEPQTVAIACHDIGEFARFHPMGRKIVHEREIKSTIMGMIDSENLEIQQQSLLALQKLMISNWQYVNSGKS